MSSIYTNQYYFDERKNYQRIQEIISDQQANFKKIASFFINHELKNIEKCRQDIVDAIEHENDEKYPRRYLPYLAYLYELINAKRKSIVDLSCPFDENDCNHKILQHRIDNQDKYKFLLNEYLKTTLGNDYLTNYGITPALSFKDLVSPDKLFGLPVPFDDKTRDDLLHKVKKTKIKTIEDDNPNSTKIRHYIYYTGNYNGQTVLFIEKVSIPKNSSDLQENAHYNFGMFLKGNLNNYVELVRSDFLPVAVVEHPNKFENGKLNVTKPCTEKIYALSINDDKLSNKYMPITNNGIKYSKNTYYYNNKSQNKYFSNVTHFQVTPSVLTNKSHIHLPTEQYAVVLPANISHSDIIGINYRTFNDMYISQVAETKGSFKEGYYDRFIRENSDNSSKIKHFENSSVADFATSNLTEAY